MTQLEEEAYDRIMARILRRRDDEHHGIRNPFMDGNFWRSIFSALAVSGIIGIIVLYAKESSLETKVEDLTRTVDQVYRLVEPHYRGGP